MEYTCTVKDMFIFMARRAIHMIAFPRVRTIYIYMWCPDASMRCKRS